MADITMCNNTDCPRKNKCYRFTAIANKYRQSYFADKMDWNTCTYFISNE